MRQRSTLRFLGTLVAAVLISGVANSPALADDSLRCGSRLVTTGDTKDKVRALCGEPTSVSLAGVQRTGRYGWGYGRYDYSYYGPAWMDVPVEIWTYNLGSSKLIRKLRFVGDELDDIKTGDYGY